MFVHVFAKDGAPITLPNFPYKKIRKIYLYKDNTPVKTDEHATPVTLFPPANSNEPDEVIVLEVD